MYIYMYIYTKHKYECEIFLYLIIKRIYIVKSFYGTLYAEIYIIGT